jgi:hypothetical protein
MKFQEINDIECMYKQWFKNKVKHKQRAHYISVDLRIQFLHLTFFFLTCNISYNGGKKIYCIIYFIYKPNSSKADYINNHILKNGLCLEVSVVCRWISSIFYNFLDKLNRKRLKIWKFLFFIQFQCSFCKVHQVIVNRKSKITLKISLRARICAFH